MTLITSYDLRTGAITGTGLVTPESLEGLRVTGAPVLIGVHGDSATQYVAFNEVGAPVLTEYTMQERTARAALAPGWVWRMPERIAVDARTLADLIASAALNVDRIADVARAAVVGDPVRVKEYERAQQQAEQFRDAGFVGTVPQSVACWATAKQWTAQQAAEDILAASARWIGALDGIRSLRLQAKEDIRRATTNAAVDAVLSTFKSKIATAMQGVQ